MSQQYGNPTGAWRGTNAPGTIDVDELPRTVETYIASAAITAKQCVVLDTDGRISKQTTTGDYDFIGIALDTATAAGQPVRVVTHGPVSGVPYTGTHPSAKDALIASAATAGSLKSGTAATGLTHGFAIADGVGGDTSGVVSVFVQKT